MSNDTDTELKDDATTSVALYNFFSRGMEALVNNDWSELTSVIRGIQERDFGERKLLKAAIEQYIPHQAGLEFTLRDIYQIFALRTKSDKNNASRILSHMADQGEIIRVGKRAGVFRQVDRGLNIMNWRKASIEGVDLKFSFGLEKMVKIFPKSIIIIAGYPDSGKTLWCLDFTRLNMEKHDIYYFNSEMGEEEFRNRLLLFDNMTEEEWENGFYPFAISSKFEDHIRPDDINIIDFLEVTEDFNLVAHEIKKIYEKLGRGIAILALQKSYNRDTGRGDTLSLEKPRLYLSMNPGQIKILKAKNWINPEVNPNNKIMNFKIVHGSKFIAQGEWASESAYDLAQGRFR